MTDRVPVARVPRPSAGEGYDQGLMEAAFQALERELATKFSRKADLALEPGKRLVLTGSGGSNRYAIGVTDAGLLSVTDYATGEVGEFVVDWEAVSGLAAQLVALEAGYEASDAALSAAISANATAIADAEGAIASLETELEAEISARTTGDSGLQTQVNARATITQLETTEASLEAAIATSASDLTAEFEAADDAVAAAAASAVSSEASARASADSAAATDRAAIRSEFAAADGVVATNAAALVTAEAGTRASADSALAARASALEATVNTPTTGNTARITAAEAAIVAGDAANATSISNLSAAVSSIRAQALPSRPAVATDFSTATAGSVTAVADISAGSVVAVANEGDVRQFTADAVFRHKGYLPVVSGRTYRVRGRARVTVNGTDNRAQVGFRYLDASFASVGTDVGSVDNAFVVADGWVTFEYTRTGAQILAAASTAAYVTSRTATGVNAGGTSSGATTQVAWVELEDITDFTTNAASITTESAARASGDSANATSITNLTATVTTNRGDLDATAWTDVAHIWAWDGAAISGWGVNLATASYPAGGGIQLTAPASPAAPDVYIRSPIISVAGSRYYKVVVDMTCVSGAGGTNDLGLFWQTSGHGESGSYRDTPRNSAAFTNGERRLLVYDLEAPTTGGTDWITNTITRIRFDLPQNASSVYIVHSVKIVGVNTQSALAKVTVTADAIADIEGRLAASYSIQVDGGGNGALVSLEDGTELGSVVRLAADQIELEGDVIVAGTVTRDRFASGEGDALVAEGIAANYYEQSGDPAPVPDGSLWFDTDTSELFLRRSGSWGLIAKIPTAGISITHSGSYNATSVGTGTRNTGSITLSPTGGSGSYTYSHELVITENLNSIATTLNSPTSATFSVSAGSNSPVKYVKFLVISTVTDSAGRVAQYIRGGQLGWES